MTTAREIFLNQRQGPGQGADHVRGSLKAVTNPNLEPGVKQSAASDRGRWITPSPCWLLVTLKARALKQRLGWTPVSQH